MLRAFFSRFIRPVLRKIGLDIIPYPPKNAQLEDSDESTRKIWEFVSPYTMTSPERVLTLIDAVRYVHDNNIPGDMVECGVWRGGSSMAMAMTLKSLGSTDRHLYLYDTFEGMSEPTDADVSFRGLTAAEELKSNAEEDEFSEWCLGTIEEVTENLVKTGYPDDKITYVKGKIEETVPGTIPNRIALLRLDTDWFESTKHEMEHLFPLLSTDGILILDDYGYWQGARKAVDEYIAEHNVRILLNRIDFTGRIAVKSAAA